MSICDDDESESEPSIVVNISTISKRGSIFARKASIPCFKGCEATGNYEEEAVSNLADILEVYLEDIGTHRPSELAKQLLKCYL